MSNTVKNKNLKMLVGSSLNLILDSKSEETSTLEGYSKVSKKIY